MKREEINPAIMGLTDKFYDALEEVGEQDASVLVWAALNMIGYAITEAPDRDRAIKIIKRDFTALLAMTCIPDDAGRLQ